MNTAQPGWYPDATNPSQLRWWDGTQWTDQVQALPAAPSTAGPQATTPNPTPSSAPAPATAPVSAPGQPGQPGGAPASSGAVGWMKAHKVLTGVAAVILLIIIAGATSETEEPEKAAASTSKDVTDTEDETAAEEQDEPAAEPTEDTAAEEEPAADEPAEEKSPKPAKPANPYGPQPAQQRQFVALAQKAMDDYATAANDLKAGAALSTRNRDMCALLGAARVAAWTGTVVELDSNGDGYGIVTIEIGPSIEVGTWNNAFSDVFDNTLIKPGRLFDKIVNLDEGQNVRFSGQFRPAGDTCVNDSRLTQSGKVEDPSFVFRFADINPLR